MKTNMTLTPAQRATLKAEAIRKLKNYVVSGMAGFLQQGLDRCTALGLDTCQKALDTLDVHAIIEVYG